mgnify:CR=1 FL=1
MALKRGAGAVVEIQQDTQWVAIPQVIQFTEPDVSAEIETVHLLDSSDEFGERIITARTCGDLAVQVAYDPANTVHQTLDELAVSGGTVTVRVTPTGGATPVVYSCAGVTRRPQEIRRTTGPIVREYVFHAIRPTT